VPNYAGRAPGFPGVDVVHFELPPDVETGCTIPLQVSADDRLSNQTTIAIAPAGAESCVHRELSKDALSRLDAGGTVVTGWSVLNSYFFMESIFGEQARGLPLMNGPVAVSSATPPISWRAHSAPSWRRERAASWRSREHGMVCCGHPVEAPWMRGANSRPAGLPAIGRYPEGRISELLAQVSGSHRRSALTQFPIIRSAGRPA
jgi:hypothetical protein